jgi:hypothetical protein
MPKPQNKSELLQAIDLERVKLNQSFEPLTETEMVQPGACEEWSVKDILAHLVDWEQRGLGWYRAGLRGETPKLPDENYNWRQTPELNHEIYLRHKDLSLDEILGMYRESYEETLSAIDGMSDEELYTPKVYAWTGPHTLGTFVNANTAAHYRWASGLIRKFARSLAK